jgi:CheY-like chemotaxis protein
MPDPRRRLLWTDDDGPDRFEYALWRLAAEGWDITWAYTVDEAATLLREQRFDAALLDQMLPFTDDEEAMNIWGGCTLMRWLKGLGVASSAPATITGPEGVPEAHNTQIPLAVVSAYRHDDVEAAMLETAPAREPPPWLGKPLDVEALLKVLRTTTS